MDAQVKSHRPSQMSGLGHVAALSQTTSAVPGVNAKPPGSVLDIAVDIDATTTVLEGLLDVLSDRDRGTRSESLHYAVRRYMDDLIDLSNQLLEVTREES